MVSTPTKPPDTLASAVPLHPGPPAPALPEWYPGWARALGELYFSGTTSFFVLHGNVHDFIRCPKDDGTEIYCNLSEFLSSQVFGSWDVVVQYDLARGLRAAAGSDAKWLQGMVQYLSSRLGDPAAWPRDPDSVLLSLDRLLERALLEEASRRKSLQVLLSHGRNSTARVDTARVKQLKKTMIERQCQGLVEFVEPKHTLDLVVGQKAAKERLQQDAELILKGQLDAAPMGYLLC